MTEVEKVLRQQNASLVKQVTALQTEISRMNVQLQNLTSALLGGSNNGTGTAIIGNSAGSNTLDSTVLHRAEQKDYSSHGVSGQANGGIGKGKVGNGKAGNGNAGNGKAGTVGKATGTAGQGEVEKLCPTISQTDCVQERLCSCAKFGGQESRGDSAFR